MSTTTCHCLIRHAVTKEDRESAAERLTYFRSIGDSQGVLITVASLGGCPGQEARPIGRRD